MADNKAAGAPALDTNIESGGFDEKRAQQEAPPATAPPKAAPVEEEEEDEDMDALIEDLESQDGHDVFEEEEETQPGGGRVVPEDMLQTDPRVGLTDAEVVNRRRKYGLNQMKEEKENLVLKFLGFFIGPIQFVMEVSLLFFLSFHMARVSIVTFGFWGPGRAEMARNSAGRRLMLMDGWMDGGWVGGGGSKPGAWVCAFLEQDCSPHMSSSDQWSQPVPLLLSLAACCTPRSRDSGNSGGCASCCPPHCFCCRSGPRPNRHLSRRRGWPLVSTRGARTQFAACFAAPVSRPHPTHAFCLQYMPSLQCYAVHLHRI